MISLVYSLVSDLLAGGRIIGGRIAFYIIGIVVCLFAVYETTCFQYKATFFATYKESGVWCIALAERLRMLPLSFFGKRDLTDLTNAVMNDG